MITPENIREQMTRVTSDLIRCSLSMEQQFPSVRKEKDGTKVDFGKADLSIALKNVAYNDIYNELSKSKSYNLKLIDGALVQFMYKFQGKDLQTHRLAFFPSPYLEDYQNNPDIYEKDEIYADIIQKNIVPFPIRFDFDCREEVFKELTHPKSHLTLGQYQNCRIPVSAPLTPSMFIMFLLQNFYNTAFKKYSTKISKFDASFQCSITPEERKIIHVQLAEK